MRTAAVFSLLLLFCTTLNAANAKIIKVLPHYLDSQGRHTTRPTLYDRDVYQASLRAQPSLRKAVRFDIGWKASRIDWNRLKMKVELRGTGGDPVSTKTLEEPVTKTGWFRQWSSIVFAGDEYKKFGNITAWRVTLWENEAQVAEQKSFLW